MSQSNETVFFEAELVPHRSLSRRGLWIIVACMCAVSLSVTTMFWAMGAWPIAGFNGGEMLLAVGLLRVHAQGRRERELLLLCESGLRILRWNAKGHRSERVLQTAWLRLNLVERAGRVPGLYLSARGRHEEVARSLGEPEKRDLAQALGAALHRMQNPAFDNPQLREG